mmetsp:Transcript_12753/g.19131  ORF Transcript_12753/g.19131 Transcript_12753/m.19131 type:complete len:115 (+) Transcript_12753:49-393(+)
MLRNWKLASVAILAFASFGSNDASALENSVSMQDMDIDAIIEAMAPLDDDKRMLRSKSQRYRYSTDSYSSPSKGKGSSSSSDSSSGSGSGSGLIRMVQHFVGRRNERSSARVYS